MLFCIIVLCLFSVATFEKNCGDEFDKFYRCVDQSKNLNHQSFVQKDNQRKSEITNCFLNNGCNKEPVFNDNYHPPSEDDQKLQQDKKQRQECRQKTHQKIRESIDKCVQENVTGFHLPNRTEQDYRRTYTMDTIKQQIPSSCQANVNNQPAVEQCLDDLELKHKKARKDEDAKRIKANCDIEKRCEIAMTIECQKQYNISKNLTCDCVDHKKKTEPDPLAQQYKDCAGSSSAQADDKPSLTSIIIAQDFDRICDQINCSNQQHVSDSAEEEKSERTNSPNQNQNNNDKSKPTGLPIRKNALRNQQQ